MERTGLSETLIMTCDKVLALIQIQENVENIFRIT
jgi:hypothetical protein